MVLLHLRTNMRLCLSCKKWVNQSGKKLHLFYMCQNHSSITCVFQKASKKLRTRRGASMFLILIICSSPLAPRHWSYFSFRSKIQTRETYFWHIFFVRLKLTTNINIWYRVVDLFFMFPKPQKRGMLFVLYFFGQINNSGAVLKIDGIIVYGDWTRWWQSCAYVKCIHWKSNT